ncbi:MAG: TIGR00645 family protein [Gammaproteobacteria bacterium]|nr:TIGR00645 family protein [Gammaproteobacteria bacterium]
MRMRNTGEKILESILFNSRWILAPVYIGLVISLLMLLTAFVTEIVHTLPHLIGMKTEVVILTVLSLIDLSLALNLVLIVVFSGYENFVSKIDTGDSEDRPQWMGTLDFSGMKMKLIGSIVAISAISLLRAFMTLSASDAPFDEARLHWMIILHLTFIASGVLFAAMDWIAALTDAGKEKEKRTSEAARTGGG